MKILVTGSKGFVGKNFVTALQNIKDGKDKTRPGIVIDEIYPYDIDSSASELDIFCNDADFVFNFAGVNRPKNNEEFMQGNCGFADELIKNLKKHDNKCPVMLASSLQATLIGRYAEGEYGKSKRAGEQLFFNYANDTGVKADMLML